MDPASTPLVVVEDHVLYVHVIRKAIKTSEKFRWCGSAATVSEGVALCERVRPAILILDLVLPDGSGWVILDRLAGHRPPEVLVLSGCTDDWTLLEARRQRVSGFIAKADGTVAEILTGLRSWGAFA